MPATVHVFPQDGQWAVMRLGGRARVFSTQREAIQSGRAIARARRTGQLAIYGRNGQMREHYTYGMPRIQDLPGKRSARIAKVVSKITLDRLRAGLMRTRG